ncbi:MAG: hypothetical protein CVT64_07850 [Actinobacteria bacterium HGW-Actinobacteria-4]|nr:MAG: hypothetical protein CVT64_07850 [Actinobacteria bacterium HGW-Actinobacteria-4]
MGIVIYFLTLLFTSTAAAQLLAGDDAAVTLMSSFTLVVVATVVVIAAVIGFSFTWGRRLYVATRRFSSVVAALIFSGVSGAIALVASFAMFSAVTLVDGVGSGEAFAAILLVLVVPAVVSGFCTRLVVDASAESISEILVAFAAAALAVGVFWWSARGYYPDAAF